MLFNSIGSTHTKERKKKLIVITEKNLRALTFQIRAIN